MAEQGKNGLTYRDAGVDVDAGNAFVEAIKPAVKSTSRPGMMGGIGGFGGLFDLKAAGFTDPIMVAATDGGGTKLKVAIESGIHNTVGIDLVAMCVNDLLAQGAEPLFFLDYFATGKLELDMGAAVVEGDVLLGLASSGPHSNGYSLIRKIVAQSGLAWDAPSPFGDGTVAESLITPTRIYVKSCLAAMRASDSVRSFAHITGGGLTENIPRVLSDNLAARIDVTSWKRPAVFDAFNCGIGMVVIVAPDAEATVRTALESEGETVSRIGEVIARDSDPVVYS